jgi:hypothetical protein
MQEKKAKIKSRWRGGAAGHRSELKEYKYQSEKVSVHEDDKKE